MTTHEFTDLILLVGTNPLPNYVVGKYFLGELQKGNFKEGSKLQRIWLVHTNRTGGAKEPLQAERLRDTIANELKFPIKNIKLVNTEHESSAKEIRKKTKDLMISEIAKLNGKVHLNYTGGTKSMSVHVYNEILNSKIQSKEFSYLEAQEFKLLRDNPDNPVIEEDMRKKVDIDFEMELLKIHGFDKTKQQKSGFENSLNHFYELVNNHDMYEYLDVMYQTFKEKNIDIINGKTNLKEIIYRIVKDLPDNYQVFENEKFKTSFLANSKENLNPRTFLREDWLEYYVRDRLIKSNIVSEDKIFFDSSIKKKNWPENFQIDVLYIKGYQLIGISCTVTKDVKECKLKGFEIIHRVKQMGGDEARAILITGLTKTQAERLQDELINETGSDGSLKVLGIEDWKKDYIIGAIKEAIK